MLSRCSTAAASSGRTRWPRRGRRGWAGPAGPAAGPAWRPWGAAGAEGTAVAAGCRRRQGDVMRDLWLRAGLGLLAVAAAVVGAWALAAPRSFYDDFPGGGRSWVSAGGPCNADPIRHVRG